MVTRVFHWLLLRLDPEFAHDLAMRSLAFVSRWFCRRQSHLPRVALATLNIPRVPLVGLRGRVGLAAGLDKQAVAFPALAQMGFAFIEVGTVTPLPQSGNAKPRLWRYPNGALVNHFGFNSVGIDRFSENLSRLKMRSSVPVLANIGKNKQTSEENAVQDYAMGYSRLKTIADGFVINISSPNTPGLRTLQNELFLEGLQRTLEKDKPVWVKLSPDLSSLELKSLCELIGHFSVFSGVVLTNTSRHLAEELLDAEVGGLSGIPLFERAVECVSIARQALPAHLSIIGVGGIHSVETAKKMFAAGADLIEVYTAFVYRGPGFIRELNRSLVD